LEDSLKASNESVEEFMRGHDVTLNKNDEEEGEVTDEITKVEEDINNREKVDDISTLQSEEHSAAMNKVNQLETGVKFLWGEVCLVREDVDRIIQAKVLLSLIFSLSFLVFDLL